jgi:hypothetical protein
VAASAALGQHTERRDADERVARPDTALLSGFEQEGARSAFGQLAIDADRSLTIGEQLADDRDHPVIREQASNCGRVVLVIHGCLGRR